jgi:hypothetical protein
MTGMTGYYRKRPEITANDRTWTYVTRHDRNNRKWPETAGNNRTWTDMTGHDRPWPETTGNDRKRPEMTVRYFVHGPRRYRMTGRYFMHGPRRYKTTGEKNFFVFNFFEKTKKWNSFQAKIRWSCKLHENRSKKMAFGINGLMKLHAFWKIRISTQIRIYSIFEQALAP